MNLKFFTTALLATGATAAMTAEQSNELTAENLHNTYAQMSEQRQRRFWVSFFISPEREMVILIFI